MTRREQIEQVLKKYGINVCPAGEHNHFGSICRSEIAQDLCALLDAPCALPDREALPIIIGGHAAHVELPEQLYDKLMAFSASGRRLTRTGLKRVIWPSELSNQLCIQFRTIEASEAFIDRIFSYLQQGEAVAPMWCKHWKWNGKEWQGTAHEKTPLLTSFEMQIAHDSGWNPLRWTVCPICAAPRPEGR